MSDESGEADAQGALERLLRVAAQVARVPAAALYLLGDERATVGAQFGPIVAATPIPLSRVQLSRPRATSSATAPELALFTSRLPLRWGAAIPLGAAGAQRGTLVMADVTARSDAEPLYEQLKDVRVLLESAIDEIDEARQRELPGARRPPPAGGRGGHDSVTGLPLRGIALAECERLIARAEVLGGSFVVLHLELDRFRRINEGMGTEAGNALLRQVAERLRQAVSDGDLVTRRSGDEFIVVANESQRSSAMLAHAIRGALQDAFHFQGTELQVSASIGYTSYPTHATDAQTLLRNAEIALTQARARGGGHVCEFDPSMESAARDRAEMEQDLRNALRDQLLTLYYQPKHMIHGRKLCGSEALVRWTHPRHGPISPLRFIPIAEETGLIAPLGAWCLLEACRQRRKWADSGLDVGPVSVNVSAVQFTRPEFVSSVRRALRESNLEPKWLELEITESVVMDDVDTAVKRLTELRGLGVRISVDDFGTGYSSLGYLTRLPLDVLKVDRSFVRDLDAEGPVGKQANAIARTVSYLGKALDLEVLAEGVETEGQLARLAECECDAVQGFLFAKPMPALEVEKYFRSKS